MFDSVDRTQLQNLWTSSNMRRVVYLSYQWSCSMQSVKKITKFRIPIKKMRNMLLFVYFFAIGSICVFKFIGQNSLIKIIPKMKNPQEMLHNVFSWTIPLHWYRYHVFQILYPYNSIRLRHHR